MKKAKKITKEERLEIGILRKKGYSMRSIGQAMGRSPNTISQELRRNQVEGAYDPKKANHKAYVRKKYSRFQWKKINKNKELKEFIIAKLKEHWNPAEIAGYMKRHHMRWYVSKNSIYRWLYSTHGSRYCQYLYSKRYTKKKRKKKTKRVMIPSRVSITQRPKGATNRSRYGHWEVDTMVSGKGGTGAISVLVERKSRYVVLNKLETLKPSEHLAVLRKEVYRLSIKSITFDNGIENRDHEQLDIPTFFCDPYSSWQKGSVENVNKMVRRYIPKGTDISSLSQSFLDSISSILNKKPRVILGFRSSCDIFGCINSAVLFRT